MASRSYGLFVHRGRLSGHIDFAAIRVFVRTKTTHQTTIRPIKHQGISEPSSRLAPTAKAQLMNLKPSDLREMEHDTLCWTAADLITELDRKENEVQQKKLEVKENMWRLTMAYGELGKLSGRVVIESFEDDWESHAQYKSVLKKRRELWIEALQNEPSFLNLFKPCYPNVQNDTELAENVARCVKRIYKQSSHSHHNYVLTRAGTRSVVVDSKLYSDEEACVLGVLYKKRNYLVEEVQRLPNLQNGE
ncbi:hypothetical protein HK097_009791 [Rhizophlyctis rosea]|uniref:Uncharacterized protein n=1 Tax=Rhizophlyctis rosea TaxID=64517 RepID=A0AAD5X070_9FUNG|nr:hypothetical protein HK097_009791 [Rhizophlyctis rosea]